MSDILLRNESPCWHWRQGLTGPQRKGSAPRHLLARVLGEGAVIAAAGIIAGVLGGIVLTRVASGLFGAVRMPGVLPIVGAATLLVTAAVLASLLPAARASRLDVEQALRSE